MHVIFFGTSAFAVPSLTTLIEQGHDVAWCITQPDRPSGRGLIQEPSPVKHEALRLRLPLVQPERLEAGLIEQLSSADIGVVAAYGQIIPRELLTVMRHGMLGVHPSFLPAYRGAAPVAWAILNGETATGMTIFRLNDRLDAGDLLVAKRVPIEPQETTETLTDRLAHLGAEALVEALEQIAAGHATFTPQDESKATFAPKLTKAQGRIDWAQPAEAIARLVRAAIPWPGATTQWQGRSLEICAANALNEPSRAGPGVVVRVTGDAVAVATGKGCLAVTEIQLAGRRRMRVREFLAGHPMRVGERLGA